MSTRLVNSKKLVRKKKKQGKKNMPTKKLYGFYRGVVKRQLSNGYCLIEIPGVLEFEDTDNLPPAEPAQSLCGGMSNGGTFAYPDTGANVWCFFANGDIRQPVYFAISNSRSPHWEDVSQKLKIDVEPKGFTDASYVHSTGIETIYGKTSISQIDTLKPDKRKSEVEMTKIDLKVLRTNKDLERISRQTIQDDGFKGGKDKVASLVNNGSDVKAAGEIIITNGSGGSVIIEGGTSIRLHAPLIEFDTTNTGAPGNGTIKFLAGNIEVRTTDGKVQVDNSNIALNIRNKKQLLLVGDKDVELKN